MKKKYFILRSIRAIVVIGVATLIAIILVKIKPSAERMTPPDNGLLVEVMPVRAENIPMMIEAYGTVKAREILKLFAEVKGKIMKIDSAFKEGAFVTTGQTLIKIDPRSYSLEVERRKIETSQVDAELKRLQQEVLNIQTSIKIAKSEAELAKAEFFRLKTLTGKKVVAQTTLDQAEKRYLSSLDRVQTLDNQLALTGPSRENLLAQRDLISVQLKQAEIDLEKTSITTPFNGRVQNKIVEVNQYVNAGEYLGSIYRAGAYDIEVRLPVGDLKWLPNMFKQQLTPEVEVFFGSNDNSYSWKGRLARIKAQLDEKTRTLPVVVEIDENSNSYSEQTAFQMRPGIFVTVRIKGKEIEQLFVLPRYMVHADDIVYLVNNNQLHFRSVKVLRRFKESVYIVDGLANGDLVVKTPLSAVTDGMRVRLK